MPDTTTLQAGYEVANQYVMQYKQGERRLNHAKNPDTSTGARSA